MRKVLGLTFLSFTADIFIVLFIIKLPKIYLMTIIFSGLLQLVNTAYDKIRTKQLGYSVYKIKGYKGDILFDFLTLFLPFVNFLYASIKYFQTTITTNPRYLWTRNDKLIPFEKTIKDYEIKRNKDKLFYIPTMEKEKVKVEYNDITEREYNTALKMLEINNYIDEIVLNVNLNSNQKKELLKKMRTEMYLTQNIRINETKILKMSRKK